jgi:hypothetical protein
LICQSLPFGVIAENKSCKICKRCYFLVRLHYLRRKYSIAEMPMRHINVQRGSIFAAGLTLRGNARYWLLWDANRPVALCLPIHAHFKPRSRWDYALRFDDAPALVGRALVVCGAAAKAIETHGLTLIGAFTANAVAAIETAMRRAAESEAVEARYRM